MLDKLFWGQGQFGVFHVKLQEIQFLVTIFLEKSFIKFLKKKIVGQILVKNQNFGKKSINCS